MVTLTLENYELLRNEITRLRALKEVFEGLANCDSKGKKMFSVVTKTWNPVTGCTHYCRYCWARKLAETKLKKSPKYRAGFEPGIHRDEFKVSFKPGELVFVSDMGDLFCGGIKDEWIDKVLNYIRKFPKTNFLLLTKNPQRYKDFIRDMPSNVILGATIETNEDELYRKQHISYAPLPSIRYKAMKDINWYKKFISIEPILDFNMGEFTKWIKEISPFMTYVGYDNYNNKLPEPPLQKTLSFIRKLSEISLVVKKTIRPAWFEGLAAPVW